MSPFPFSYKSNATVLVMGVGLMGQHMASNVLNWLDVKKLVIPALRHRVLLAPSAEIEGVSTEDIVRQVLEQVPAPR